MRYRNGSFTLPATGATSTDGSARLLGPNEQLVTPGRGSEPTARTRFLPATCRLK